MKTYRKVLTPSFWIQKLALLFYHWILLNKPLSGWREFLQSLPPDFTLEIIEGLKVVRPWKTNRMSATLRTIDGELIGVAYSNGMYFITLPEFSTHGKTADFKSSKAMIEKILKERDWKF